MFIFVSISRGWHLLFKEDKDDACFIYLKYFLKLFRQNVWISTQTGDMG
jgi:hypothetical protein